MARLLPPEIRRWNRYLARLAGVQRRWSVGVRTRWPMDLAIGLEEPALDAAARCRCRSPQLGRMRRRGAAGAASPRRSYQRRLDRDLSAIMVLAPANRHGKRLRKRCGRNRSHLLTFLDHPDTPPDNNGSERELRPTATYRKVTGGFDRTGGADLFAAVRSVVGAAARHGTDAYQAFNAILGAASVLKGG